MRRSFVIVLIVALLPLQGLDAARAQSAAAPPDDPLPLLLPRESCRRIVVVGASLTLGFGTSRELGFDLPLAMLLDRMLLVPHETVRGYGGHDWLNAPIESGKGVLERASQSRATALVAIDFPFWFAYAKTDSEHERLTRIEGALSQLDEWMQKHDGPIVIGTVPSLERKTALQFLVDFIISPEPATLQRINRRITEWASARPRVHLIPLHQWIADVRAGRALDLGFVKWPEKSTGILLQEDGLHPRVEAFCGIAVAVFDGLARMGGGLAKGQYEGDARLLAMRIRERFRSIPTTPAPTSGPPRR